MKFRLIALTSIGLILRLSATGCAQQYTASILYPLNVPSGFQPLQNSSVGSVESISQGMSGGFGQFGSLNFGVETDHALLWTSAGVQDLNPSGITASAIMGNYGTQQVGTIYGNETNSAVHASIWHSSTAGVTDLNTASMVSSIAYSTNGSQQVGSAGYSFATGTFEHAELWNGSADSALDLNPTKLGIGPVDYSQALGTDGVEQVGIVENQATANYALPVLWKGTADSAIDLTPRQFGSITQGAADGVYAGQQVGYVSGTATGNQTHAFLWTGSAQSAVDLNPNSLGFLYSAAINTNGYEEVGDGGFNANTGPPMALVWSGTANSAVSLQSFLPSNGTWTASTAESIDAQGDIFGFAYNSTYNGFTGDFAVEWTPVPESKTLPILALLIAVKSLAARRFNHGVAK